MQRGREKRGPVPVLLMVRELALGGIERDVAKLALRFDRERFIPYVATYKPFGPRFDELTRAGIPILHLDFPSLLSGKAIGAAAKLRRFIREKQIQIVHAFDPSSVFGVPLARLLGVPVVLSSQLGHRELHDPRTRSQLRYVDRWSDVVVVNCEALRTHLATQHQVPREKVELCYNGVETSEFRPDGPAAEIAGIAGSPFVIGTVCVLRSEKALDLLISAFARVRYLVPGSKLLIVGNGPEREKLEVLKDNLGLGDSCVFRPAVASVAPVMRAMDVFVSCSLSEAFSNAILEAMACGRAVVGSRVGGTPELLGEGGERGLLFARGDAEDLAAQLARLMTDKNLRQSIAERAAHFARTSLGIETNVARTMQIYDMLLSRKGLAA